jgi:molybdopterin-guanine dinucleotide biosynthesis protein A
LVNLVEQAEHYVSCIECPHLLIKATDSPLYMSDDVAERLINVMKNNNSDFVYKTIEGGHHVHMDKAADVAKIVSKFLASPFTNSGSEEKENMTFSM